MMRLLRWFAAALFSAAAAMGATLAEYGTSHLLELRTVARGVPVDLGDGNQTNNLKEGGKVLVLSGAGLTSLEGISRLPALAGATDAQLFLNRNALAALPDEFAALRGVTFVYLNYNRFTEFPKVLTRMRGLQGIYLTGNRIAELPPELFAMTQLRKLQLSKNRLTRLPSELGNLVNLIHFNFSDNELTAVPATMGRLRQLRVCDLSDNRIADLPDAFGQVRILYQLRVRNNPLRRLPEGFARMPGTIDITGTQIRLADLPPALRARISTEKPLVKPKRDE